MIETRLPYDIHGAARPPPHFQSLHHYTVFQKKTSTHIIGYKLRNSCPILIIFDTKIPHVILQPMTA